MSILGHNAAELQPAIWVAFTMALIMALATSIFAAASMIHWKSDTLTLPVKSTWLQQKHEFRVNGAKLIEQGFVEVSSSPTLIASSLTWLFSG